MSDKTGTIAQQLVRRVADVASKTASKLSPIVEATVISRNPDGSLNVDDGRGGCLRVAPKANVRVGEKIRLGTEPAIGTQTSLQQVSLEIDPSTKPCPDDPRDCIPTPGVDCPVPVEALASYSAGQVDSLTFFPTQPTVWANRDSTAVHVLHNNALIVAAFSSPHYACYRFFLEFDTAPLAIPAGAVISSAQIEMSQVAAPVVIGLPLTDDPLACVLPSTAPDFPLDITAWNAFDRSLVLCQYHMRDAVPLDLYPTGHYNIIFPLDLIDPTPYINKTGLTKFAMLAGMDVSGSIPTSSPQHFENWGMMVLSTLDLPRLRLVYEMPVVP